jgi:hypothetical protein
MRKRARFDGFDEVKRRREVSITLRVAIMKWGYHCLCTRKKVCNAYRLS